MSEIWMSNTYASYTHTVQNKVQSTNLHFLVEEGLYQLLFGEKLGHVTPQPQHVQEIQREIVCITSAG